MLQLKHIQLLNELTGVPLSEIKPVKFGYAINWSIAADYVLASSLVALNRTLIVLRVECYTGCWASGVADFRMYGPPPPGNAWWISAEDTGVTNRIDLTNPNTPAHLTLDSDELRVFETGRFANILASLPDTPDGVDRPILTRVFGYLVPPRVVDLLSSSEGWTNVQM